jgi:hypothetical protein
MVAVLDDYAWREAQALIERYGTSALPRAVAQAKDVSDGGNRIGAGFWEIVAFAIGELQRDGTTRTDVCIANAASPSNPLLSLVEEHVPRAFASRDAQRATSRTRGGRGEIRAGAGIGSGIGEVK